MNVRLTWAWPNVSNRQRPIKEAVIEGRVAGIDVWTEINRVAGDATAELLIENIAPGDWEFRGRAVDDLGQESDNVTASVSVPFDNPDPLVSFSAAVE